MRRRRRGVSSFHERAGLAGGLCITIADRARAMHIGPSPGTVVHTATFDPVYLEQSILSDEKVCPAELDE